jgi:dTDP-4-amino-4,6-dideoxygalactose transaminase
MQYCERDFQIDGGNQIKMRTTKEQIRISVGEFRIDRAERDAINKVLDSGRISEGETVRKFEEEWARYIGTKYSVALNSGTSALIAGLTALKCTRKVQKKRNAKIITTPITYVATSNAIVLTGFEPVYVDVDQATFCITPENIRECLEKVDDSEEYSLILPVHLMGYPCDMDEINKIARDYGLLVFEDSAQAHGSLYKSEKVGSLSLLSDFSFYVAHNIQVGEMGAVVTNDYEITRAVRKIKANGRMCDCPICTRNTVTGCPKMRMSENDFDPRFTHDLIGYNFKTMEFQAALGLTQLERMDWIIERRRENVKYLTEGLEEFSGGIQLPICDDNVSYMAYPIVIKNPKKTSRRKIRIGLEQRGVETRPLFGCIPTQQPAYSHLKHKYEGMLPVAEFVGSNGFYIGCHQYLTQEDLDYAVKAFGAVYDEILG